MRCNRRMLFLKVKDFLILTVVFSALIILITVINHKPTGKRAGGGIDYASGGGGGGGLYHNYENRPGRFLAEYRPAPNHTTYCRFRYGLPAALRYDAATQVAYSPELGARSPYRVLYDAIATGGDAGGNGTTARAGPVMGVTYATHITPEFVHYVAEIALHWQGAVSVTAFVPDSDVTDIVSSHTSLPATFRSLKKLPYPVNVARNVARAAARTHYVLVADAELIPSERLAEKFLGMLEEEAAEMGRLGAGGEGETSSVTSEQLHKQLIWQRRAFVVPVFEIEQFEKLPRTKTDLLRLVREEKALYFHRHICSHCQKFPAIETWLQQDPGDKIKPLVTVKREYPFHRWEPIYIGTKNEPLYSELLSWEGKQDKMTQMLEMCLKRYRFVILDGAFLIHWPGVKRKSVDLKIKNQWRYPYLVKNMRQYTNIVNKLATQYSKTPKCKVQ